MVWSCRCPAKLNLFLSVGPPDARGWHPLRSIFQAIDFYDRLTVTIAEADRLVTNVDYLPPENTLTKALDHYRKLVEIPPLEITLEKVIPAQSGLGGGSSDAAGLLRILQKIAPIEEAAMAEIALKIGADVPFFLVGGQAKAEGYGEQIEPLPDCPERFFLVIKPQVDCSTVAMFRALDQLDYEWRLFPENADEPYNDFERVMPKLCSEYIERLGTMGALSSALTGSGSAVFGEFGSHTEALTARELLENLGEENLWVCRTLNREESLLVETDLN